MFLSLEVKAERLEEVRRELELPSVWEKPDKAQALGRERAQLEAVVDRLHALAEGVVDCRELFDMAREESDEQAIHDVASDVQKIQKKSRHLSLDACFQVNLIKTMHF